METNLKTYGGDTTGLSQLSYIRINDQPRIRVARPLARPAAERWRTTTTGRGAVLELIRANLPALPTASAPLALNVWNEESEPLTIQANPTTLASAVASFNARWAEKEWNHQRALNQRPDYLAYTDVRMSCPMTGTS